MISPGNKKKLLKKIYIEGGISLAVLHLMLSTIGNLYDIYEVYVSFPIPEPFPLPEKAFHFLSLSATHGQLLGVAHVSRRR